MRGATGGMVVSAALRGRTPRVVRVVDAVMASHAQAAIARMRSGGTQRADSRVFLTV